MSATTRGQVESLTVQTDDGVGLKIEVTGSGPDVLFIHEFSGNHASWRHQIEALSGDYRCIAYSARGFLPSDVPEDPAAYSQERVVLDACCVLDAVATGPAHVVGLSMGGFTALLLALEHPDRLRSAVAGSCGYGAEVDEETFQAEMHHIANLFRTQGSAHVAELSRNAPFRLALAQKNPAEFEKWVEALAAHDPLGAAHTVLGVQARRPTMLELARRMRALTVPVLLVVGDEDDPCIEANVLAKRSSPMAGLAVMSRTAHTINIEDPPAFNDVLVDFFAKVDTGRWQPRDPRSIPKQAGGWVRPADDHTE